MAWPKGVSGNPGGRQPGVGRARQLGEALLIRAEDTRSPKAFLLAVMRNEQAHSQLRLAAAIAVARGRVVVVARRQRRLHPGVVVGP